MKSFRSAPILAAALILVLLAAAPAYAQRDAVIAGKVTDPDGNPIAGAEVQIQSADRGDVKMLRTNDDGEYLGRGFRPEIYVVRVSAEGFIPAENTFKANLGMNTVDLTMMVGAPEPDVDYGALNQLYEDAFSTYEKASSSGAPGDWEQARSLVTDLIGGMEGLTSQEAQVMRTSAYEILGRAALELGDSQASLDAWQAILDEDPDSLVANVWTAQVYTRNSDYASAMPYLQKAAELAPDDASVQYNAGAVMLQQNQVEEGIAAMERALELRPDGFPVALKNLGYAYLRVQRYEDAVTMLEKYLEQSPDAPDRADVEQMIVALKAQIEQ